jgi:hypothetical protein
MRFLRHEGRLKIITPTPSETKREIREAVGDRFRYTFSDDIAVGDSVIQFSGRIWGALLSRSPLGLIDEGQIRFEESKNSVLVDYFISYSQIGIIWTIVSGVSFLLLFLALSDFEPIIVLLGPFTVLAAFPLIMGIGILRFEALLGGCLEKANAKVIKVLD